MLKQKRVLPADVYDTLEFVAEAYGGIGAGTLALDAAGRHVMGSNESAVVPVCIYGAADFATSDDERYAMTMAIYGIGIDALTSDRAVQAINVRGAAADPDARVPFAEWCAELGVERGS